MPPGRHGSSCGIIRLCLSCLAVRRQAGFRGACIACRFSPVLFSRNLDDLDGDQADGVSGYPRPAAKAQAGRGPTGFRPGVHRPHVPHGRGGGHGLERRPHRALRPADPGAGHRRAPLRAEHLRGAQGLSRRRRRRPAVPAGPEHRPFQPVGGAVVPAAHRPRPLHGRAPATRGAGPGVGAARPPVPRCTSVRWRSPKTPTCT